MKGLKLGIATCGLIAAASSANAAFEHYDFAGSLLSYTATIPSVGTINGTFDGAGPTIDGYFFLNADPGSTTFSGALNWAPTNIHLGSSALKSIPWAYASLDGTPPTSISFNPATGRLLAQKTGAFKTRDIYCYGLAAICGPLYTEGNAMPDDGYRFTMRSDFQGTLDVTFDAAHTQFTGTFTEVDTLASGAVITKVYALTSDIPPPPTVPVPFAGVLFGSSLLVLGGIARHRNQKN